MTRPQPQWQRYDGDQFALDAMAKGLCPECAWPPEAHTGLGGPADCTLSDMGVAGRIWQYRRDRREEQT